MKMEDGSSRNVGKTEGITGICGAEAATRGAKAKGRGKSAQSLEFKGHRMT